MWATKISIRKGFSWQDIAVLGLLFAVIFGISQFARQWNASFQPNYQIDLSYSSLPLYALLSTFRGLIAYLFSLFFSLIVGYTAARSRKAERIIIPMLDILQSIPVLGFLPGLVLGFIALFPRSNAGIELAAILMIFTGQVWNMAFAFYSSLKTIPEDFMEASKVMGLSLKDRFRKMEFPFSAINLAWNSLMSMAGGWFFLSICESFSLGGHDFHLPGLGAYISVASAKGNSSAMFMGMLAMVIVIVGLDTLIWRPVLYWVQRFRVEDYSVEEVNVSNMFIQMLFRQSRIVRWVGKIYRKQMANRKKAYLKNIKKENIKSGQEFFFLTPRARIYLKIAGILSTLLIGYMILYGLSRWVSILKNIPSDSWFLILTATACTFGRVFTALLLSSLWTIPIGVWLARTPRRLRWGQPIIQVLASFPAPMLYPLAYTLMIKAHVSLEYGATFLMMLGVQWYILFNVLPGALRTPTDLIDIMSLGKNSRWSRWTSLYLPSIFPSLITGWVTAAGGAWNASIVAEYLSFGGKTDMATGLGSVISHAAVLGDFQLLIAAITVMVVVVILVNRFFWAYLYQMAQQRFRLVY